MVVVLAGRYTMADDAGRRESYALLYFRAVRGDTPGPEQVIA